jgi:hypothetical protein
MSNNALDATFDYLNGRSNSAVISLVPVKAQLAGEPGVSALCNPPEQAVALMVPFIQSQLQTITTLLPNEVTLISNTASGTPQDPRARLNAVRSGIKLTLFLPVLFLFGIAVFAVRSLRDLFIWWGWPLLLAGGISVLVALLGAPVIGGILRLVIQNQGAFFVPSVLAAALGETASAVAQEMLIPVLIQGLIIAAIGVGLLALAILIPKRSVEPMV